MIILKRYYSNITIISKQCYSNINYELRITHYKKWVGVLEIKVKPMRLEATKNEIAKVHKKSSKPSRISDDIKTEALITKLASLSERALKKETLLLKNEQLFIIARYLPHNYYEIKNYKNFFYILNTRINENNKSICEALFKEWQKIPNETICNKCLKNLIAENEVFADTICNGYITKGIISEIISSEKRTEKISDILKSKIQSGISFEEKYKRLCLDLYTTLFFSVKKVYFTVCSREDYLLNTNLLEVVEKYASNKELGAFLSNFLDKLTLKEIKRNNTAFQNICIFIRDKLGVIDGKKWKGFFENPNMLPDTERKFISWLNYINIGEYFGNDERSVFWQKYDFEKVEKLWNSNLVIMYFKKYFVVEFLKKGSGPLYIYDNTVSNQNIITRKIKKSNKSKLKPDLYKNRNMGLIRIEHKGNWQYKTSSFLISIGIYMED